LVRIAGHGRLLDTTTHETTVGNGSKGGNGR
jgi:hypothetical protein